MTLRKLMTWGVALLILVDLYCARRWSHRPSDSKKQFTEGQDVDVSITLVSTDIKSLACASEEDVEGRHCEYASSKEKWSKAPAAGMTAAEQTLSPYKSSDDDMFLIADSLWQQPALRERLSIDPPDFRLEHARFNANCKLHIVGKMPKLQARWELNAKWHEFTDIPIGTVSDCTAAEP